MNSISIISFILATSGVAIFTYWIVSGMKKSDNATEEYFTGGRSLVNIWMVRQFIFSPRSRALSKPPEIDMWAPNIKGSFQLSAISGQKKG